MQIVVSMIFIKRKTIQIKGTNINFTLQESAPKKQKVNIPIKVSSMAFPMDLPQQKTTTIDN